MLGRVHLKDHLFETRLITNRAILLLVAGGLLLSILLVRLLYLQVVSHEHYTTLSEDNRVKLQPLPPNRGLIFDRNGILLAENMPSYRLEITPEQVDDMGATLGALEDIIEIRNTDRSRFEKLLARKPRFEAVPLRFHLNDEEVARFSVNRHRFPGVDITAGLARHYPQGPLAVHALGYVGRIDEKALKVLDSSNYRGTSHVGKNGIEKTYEELLHGKVGLQQVETTAQGRIIRVLKRTPPVSGSNLYLTIDSHVQKAAEQAFADFSGSAIAMDPNNGDILAFVSKPTYDPNPFVNGIDYDAYAALRNNDKEPLFNRALRGQYPPGSTVKPFMGLAGLETGITSEHSKTYCPGFYMLPGKDRKYRDWKRTGHGTVDLNSAITQSCDVYFYDLAQSMGIDRIHDYLQHFGFGKAAGIDIQGELPGLLPSKEWKRSRRDQPWFPGETIITGIGQGFFLVTPIQLAVATAALANGGQMLKPQIVHAEQEAESDELQPHHPQVLETLTIGEQQHWDMVIHAMTDVVHGARGTARSIGKDSPYMIAGKTGTAQVFGLKEEEKYDADAIAEKLRDHALFIAFAPLDDPKIAVAVIVENGGGGGSVAAPIARTIMDAYLGKPTP
ncbi:MAG: penicillin-binding protein 2 [Gammaproteobacteria bacterium]|nr:penicillin-binding protein 2 [Gammaproteobacteria bacterium]MDH3887489.1 penicillin-binding protein 2 [Gammaproteobacteria bacterium]MDH3971464.1 penicillin-binding protein 2 [Gammaproteobacteria bacterium]